MTAPALPTIGTKFLYRQSLKYPKLVVWTVRDIWTTTNAAGNVVKTEYRCTHQFCGMAVESGFPAVSIQMAIADHGVQE